MSKPPRVRISYLPPLDDLPGASAGRKAEEQGQFGTMYKSTAIWKIIQPGIADGAC